MQTHTRNLQAPWRGRRAAPCRAAAARATPDCAAPRRRPRRRARTRRAGARARRPRPPRPRRSLRAPAPIPSRSTPVPIEGRCTLACCSPAERAQVIYCRKNYERIACVYIRVWTVPRREWRRAAWSGARRSSALER